jgi:hypothetical protein
MYVVCIYIPEEELASVKAMSLELLPTIQDTKHLRGGAFSGVLEEFAEVSALRFSLSMV